MSKLLEDLRLEQEHYKDSDEGRSMTVKIIADHIESLEKHKVEFDKIADIGYAVSKSNIDNVSSNLKLLNDTLYQYRNFGFRNPVNLQ